MGNMAETAGWNSPGDTKPTLFAAPQWSRADTVIIVGLLVAAAISRFFSLGKPAAVVFDEVFPLGVARNFLQHLPYRDTHPPFPGELIAVCIKLFGDRAWSRRLPTACLGTALVGITYLLGRRMFNSRLTGAIAAGCVLCDGLFLVDSRLALWEIVYLTFAAFAYLMVFRFAQTADPRVRRRCLLGMGLALGFSLGSKLAIPGIAVVLSIGATLFVVDRRFRTMDSSERVPSGARMKEMFGVVALVGGLTGLVYFAIFLPIYWFGWWHGIRDQITYYRTEYQFQMKFTGPRHHPYSSPWWSWPLMLRPIRYYFQEDFIATATGGSPSIRNIGNPILWWGALVAIVLVARQVISRRNAARAFIVLGYLLFFGMWIPIGRYQFIYYYMPALYMGFLALAAMLADCWHGATKKWEEGVLLIALAPPLIFGLGATLGVAAIVLIAISYVVLARGGRNSGRLILALYVGEAVILFFYFLPLWVGSPITRSQFGARMWLAGPGLADWN